MLPVHPTHLPPCSWGHEGEGGRRCPGFSLLAAPGGGASEVKPRGDWSWGWRALKGEPGLQARDAALE